VPSINVSGVQLKNAAELEREVEESLSHWNIDSGDIELELTESVLMEATQRHSNTLQNLRRLGTKIAIDDFGTGYSSLKYLTQYPVNRLKLAQEFVLQVTVDYRNAAVVRAAIRLANELGQEVIAEGVETDAQVRFLLGAGCEQAQGYYFSQPVTAQKATSCCGRDGSSLRQGRGSPPQPPKPDLTDRSCAARRVCGGPASSGADPGVRHCPQRAARAESNPRKACEQGSPVPAARRPPALALLPPCQQMPLSPHRLTAPAGSISARGHH